MTVNFYKIEDDFRVVNKTLGTPVKTLSIDFLASTSLSNPELILSYDSDIASCNYMKFVEVEKHYFFPQPTLSPGGRLLISGTDDVLMNNREKILDLHAYVTRSESSGNDLMVDGKRPVQANRHCKTLPFNAHPFVSDDQGTNINYTLTVIGGRKYGT